MLRERLDIDGSNLAQMMNGSPSMVCEPEIEFVGMNAEISFSSAPGPNQIKGAANFVRGHYQAVGVQKALGRCRPTGQRSQ